MENAMKSKAMDSLSINKIRSLRFSTRYKICQQILSLMTKKATMIYNSSANKQFKFNIMMHLGRKRSLVEIRRLEVLPKLKIEEYTYFKIMAFIMATKDKENKITINLISHITDSLTRVD